MIHFLLTPDTASALKLRRMVATAGGRTDVLVGTWPELLQQARNSFVLPPAPDTWNERFMGAARELSDAFWSKSLAAVNPTEKKAITAVLAEHLSVLLEATGPGGLFAEIPGLDALVEKPKLLLRIADFAELHQAIEFALPPRLQAVRSILDAPASRAIRTMRVYAHPAWPELSLWQTALVLHLNSQAEQDEERGLRSALTASVATPSAVEGSSLRLLQDKLFTQPKTKAPLDTTIQWLKVRDYLQEVEVIAGMIQEAMKNDASLRFADMGVLLPEDSHYSRAVSSVFSTAGIPVSGLRSAYEVRDLGGEAVLNLIHCMDQPAPLIALAALLSSPLMPWSRNTGNKLAQSVVELRTNISLHESESRKSHTMLQLIQTEVTGPGDVKRILKEFPSLLNTDECTKFHRERVEKLCAEVVGAVDESSPFIQWPELQALVPTAPLDPSVSPEFTREGVAVFYESAEPWRTVRKLFAAGCLDGHHPQTSRGSIIFRDEELDALKEATGLDIDTAAARNGRNRKRFLRQLSSATEGITFLVPGKDQGGESFSPSSSVTFATALFADMKETEELILHLEQDEEREKARGLPDITDRTPLPPRSLQPTEDLVFEGENLLEISKDKDGALKLESPSRLDTLLVSPLAWLLERLNVKAREWRPETLDVMTMGTLAHAVFEHLFTTEGILDAEEIYKQVPVQLEAAIRRHCPFMLLDEWKIERENLTQSVLKAASEWAIILESAQARVVATEISLKGNLDGLPIHGNADLLLELPGNRMMVVDYKKSGSSGRRDRMEAGYDLQASLYRKMVRTGGPEKENEITKEAVKLLKDFKSKGDIGSLYYLMNDQVALSDTSGWFGGISGLLEMGANISEHALKELAEFIKQVQSGEIRLNSESDEKTLAKDKKLSAYALKDDGPPLIRLFMKPAEDIANIAAEDGNE